MTPWLQLVPVPVILFMTALILLPSAVAIWVRFSLYHILKNLSQNLKNPDDRKIEDIKKKINEQFKRATTRLDFTNTTDILEKFYSQEKLFGFMSYDYCDNFCQSLPNLLIAFGLLGTFLGITLNLGDISSILNQDGDGASLVVANLKAPLQSMGIAFITSLVAILFSSLLTILNLLWNTETAKYNLFITLEEYLEIDFSPVEDKATTLLKNVLYGQGENTSNSLDSVLTTVLNYFVPSLTTSIESFTGAVKTFETQVGIMQTSAESIKESFSKLDTGDTSFSNSSRLISEAAKLIQNNQTDLYSWLERFEKTHNQFDQSAQSFANNIRDLVTNNTAAISAIVTLEAQLRQSGERFEKSSQNYLKTAESLAVSQFPERLQGASDNLHQFSQFAADLNKIILDFQAAIPTIQALGESTQHLNQQSGEIITLNQQRLTQEEKELAAIQGQLSALIELMKKSQAESLSTLDKNVNALITILSQEMEINAQKLQDLYQGMNIQTQRTEAIQGELVKLTGNFTQGLELINNQGQSGARQLEAIQGSFSALVRSFKQYQDSLTLKQDLLELSQRIASTLSQETQKQTQEIGEMMALENRKSNQESANLSYSLNVSLSHLEGISLKLSKLTSLIQDLTPPQNLR